MIESNHHHAGRYFQSKPLPILASAKRPCLTFVIITVYFTCIASKPSMWLSGLMAVHTLGKKGSDSEALSRWAAMLTG